MPEDFPLLMKCLAIALPVGLIGGLVLRLRFPHLAGRWAAYRRSLPWWHYAIYTGFFALLAFAQVGRGWWSFMVLFSCIAGMEFVMMMWVLYHPHKPATTEGEKGSS